MIALSEGGFKYKILFFHNTICMNFTKNLKENLENLKAILKSDDINFLSLKVANKESYLIFAKELSDKDALGQLVIKPLKELDEKADEEDIFNVFYSPEKEILNSIKKITDSVVLGDAVLLVDGLDKAFAFGLKKYEKRAIAEPPTSTVIKGPREGFVESLPVNVSLIRRKIKSPNLKFINLSIGEYSNTPVSICYIEGICDQSLVKEIEKKLKKISIDAVLDSSYVSKFLGEHKRSLFKQVGNTEKPDILAAKILEGRVAIFVDGSPIALTVPYLLIEDFQSPSDYYGSTYSATISRIIRFIAVYLSLSLPAFFVSAELFHMQFIPLSFLLTIENSIKGIPLSPSYEMFVTLFIFEILNEASVRMPRYVGMVVSIVGGLVLGETAVNAGIISAPTLMIVAFSGICLYTVPELNQSLSVARLIFLIVAGSIGAYGILALSTFFMLYLVSFECYQTPLLAPFSPLVTSDLKDAIFKGFISDQQMRPKSIRNQNKKRINPNN